MSVLDRRELLKRAGAGAALLALPGEAFAATADSAETDAQSAEASAAVRRRALRQLEREVSGPVLVPGDRGYRRARRPYNRRFDGRRPDIVVQAASVDDVAAVVRWADRHDVRVTARSGGHSYEGYSTPGTGVLVDLGRLRGVGLDLPQRRATVQAGAQLIDVYSRLARRGVTVPAGSCPSVGIGGLTLGGGMGLAGRKLGLTCDSLTAARIVTADGRNRRIDRTTEPDLFWACQGGGGGQFGIVTSFEFQVHRAPRVSYFFLSWPWGNAGAALDAWQDFAPDAPAALTSILTLSTGGPTVRALGQFFGSERRLRRLIRPLTRVGGASVSVGSSPYMSAQMRWAGCLDRGLRACHTRGESRGGTLPRESFHAGSDYVARRLSAAGRRRMIRAIERRQRDGGLGTGALILDAYGGAINRVEPDATAFVHRDQRFSVQYLAYYPDGSGRGRRAARSWLRSARADLRRHVSGQAYQNYIDADLDDWRRAYYGRNLERLEDVKTAYDPDGRFSFRQGIKPGT